MSIEFSDLINLQWAVRRFTRDIAESGGTTVKGIVILPLVRVVLKMVSHEDGVVDDIPVDAVLCEIFRLVSDRLVKRTNGGEPSGAVLDHAEEEDVSR